MSNPRSRLRSVSRQVRRHRRALAAVTAGLAVWALVTELHPNQPTTAVVVAAHAISAGSPITADDLRVEAVTGSIAGWPGLLNEPSAIVGRVASVAVPAGAPVPVFALVTPSTLDLANGDDAVAIGIRPSDPLASALVTPGDLVDVWASSQSALGSGGPARQAVRVAAGVRVLAVVRGSGAAAGPVSAPGAMTGSTGGSSSGGLVVLAIPAQRAGAVARANAGDAITLAVLSTQAR